MMDNTPNTMLRVVGIGGTLRENSTSLWALQRALESARSAGAITELLDLRRLNLPMFEPDKELDDYNPTIRDFVRITDHADALLISTAAYHGTLAGVTKNALDYFEYLTDPAHLYLENKFVGLIATAGGDQAATNSINAMVHVVHSLRGMALPLSVPIHNAKNAFDTDGNVIAPKYITRLDKLGQLLVETTRRYQALRVAT
jgi:FMN reductase